jgi:hypothetical protein
MRGRAPSLALAAFAVFVGVTTFGFDRVSAQTPAKPADTNAVKIPAALPPDVAFGRFIALIRGHLLTGEELVKQRDWDEAHAHFMFPLEEIYGVIRESLRDYKTPPFDGALRALARTVRSHSVRHYAKALEKVQRALAAADADLKARQKDWPRFELTVAVEVLKAAAEEYEDAIADGRIVHAVGYRTARGFVLQADRMIDGVAGELATENAVAVRELHGGLSQLKLAFAAVEAPKRTPMDAADLLAVVSRIESAAGKLK